MQNNSIVLFDLDGTLTPARQKITSENIHKIVNLLEYCRVGIVTGSEVDYVEQQVDNWLFEEGLEVFPCNGTEHWVFDTSKEKLTCLNNKISMKDLLKNDWNKLQEIICLSRLNMMKQYPDIPLTGHFVSYRGSLINFCPIGRQASFEERKAFEKLDKEFKIRETFLKSIIESTKQIKTSLNVKIAGTTSFDIFPQGWDKTFVLNHLLDCDVWFVGDRCYPDGNDFEIYESLKPKNRAFSVVNEKETPNVIDEIIKKLQKDE